MLELKQITKDYVAGSGTVTALKGIDLKFRSSEFVSVLGPSGCGKTTMLNIIGGLDQYTSGDLLINGVSTKEYKDRDWDSYRNHSVGFVFQSYNLIPHQTVLQNVEIALTLSGVSKAERRARAKEALEKVGLGDQLRKKPNAMSGGQMQRVAIARALVNNPDIILADEPTGALDTETSMQVMELLKEVSKDRLVVMVTHNPELAEKYSSRIIRMLDGVITSDSRPFTEEEYQMETAADKEKAEKKSKEKKPTMSFWTAFRLSLTNLFTKKGRTTLTAFAGSIGIIGIALILAVSQGMTGYINHVQQTTLASYPLTLEAKTMDMGSLMESFLSSGEEGEEHGKDAIYKDPIIGELVNALAKVETTENDLKSFKTYLEGELEKEDSAFKKALRGVQYSYNLELAVYTENVEGNIVKSDTGELMSDMLADFFIATSGNGSMGAGNGSSMEEGGNAQANMMSSMMTVDMWQELLPGLGKNEHINTAITDQYELIDGGSWPNEYDEIVLIVNERNELDDLTLYALGLLTQAEIDAIIDAAAKGQELPKDNRSWSYEEIKARTYKSILPADCYQKVKTKDGDVWMDTSTNTTFLSMLYADALELKVTGIIRPKEDAEVKILSSGIGYLSSLTEYVISKAASAPVVQAQIASPSVDVLTGKPFKSNTSALTPAQKETQFRSYVDALETDAKKAEVYLKMKCTMSDAELASKTTGYMMAHYPNREAQQALVLNTMAQQLGMNPDDLQEYFVEMTDEQIKNYAFIVCQGIVQAMHVSQVTSAHMSAGKTDAEWAAELDGAMAGYTTEQCAMYYDKVTDFSKSTYEDNLVKFGCLDVDSPASINLYASSFENKDLIVSEIARYNDSVSEEHKIDYTDYMGFLMSSITQIIDAITYVLIAFVSISLVVSSIMIGVITLISVQERTKEIGILRAIGASKRDVSSMFNAETIIIGFAAGLLGVGVTCLLCVPINLILRALTGIAALKAVLPFGAAVILIGISILLTLVAGLIPSRSAAKKDPVVALRTE